MPFEPGHNLSKGRPKGSKNKFQVGDDVKQHIADLLAYKTERDFEDLDTMSPYERQRLKNELRKYTVPTLKAMEIETTTQEDTNQEFLEQLMDIPEDKFETYYNNEIED